MDFEINRQDFRDTRSVDSTPSELTAGQIRLAVERFAFTTNNISYAVAGDLLDYWGFFPAEAPWGRLPAMGLGSIIESAHPDIEVGGRYFGFYPMSTEHVIDAKPSGDAFRDVGPHRAKHAGTYTGFRNVATDPMFQADKVDEYLLLWGLFMTSFLADDYLADNDFHGAAQTLVTSASSKTSISLAACLARREGHRSIGLTSERNREFVEGLGLYDDVITYDGISQLDSTVASGMVDMAGSDTVRSDIHNHFGDQMKFSLSVGATRWEDPSTNGAKLPGAQPEFFFAPSQISKRTNDWGADTLGARIAEAFHELLDDTEQWLTVIHRTGAGEVEETYRDLLEGRADPSVGYVVSLSPDALTSRPNSHGSSSQS